jgi:FixJ family two-component response regulator
VGRRIVHILDDDLDVADSLALLVHSLGHDPVVWYDPQAFLDDVAMAERDVVLLDIRMPVLSGWDVMRALRARGLQNDIVFMTGHGSEAYLSQGEVAARANILPKPFSPIELRAAISD